MSSLDIFDKDLKKDAKAIAGMLRVHAAEKLGSDFLALVQVRGVMLPWRKLFVSLLWRLYLTGTPH